jgi:FkbM family methyltransferase
VIPLVRALAYRLRTRPRLGRLALALIPDLRWHVEVPDIGRLAIRLRRNRSLWLRDPLESEHFPFTMLRGMVRPGDVVYDAGANLGLYCRYLVSCLGAGEVVAFEPISDNRRLLARNLELGGIAERVRVLPFALADADGEADFQVDDMQSTSGTLDRVSGGRPAEGRRNLGLPPLTERVACRSLDRLLAEATLPPPDLIKIDVEGAEGLLLRGARRLLQERGPRLLVELHGAAWAREVIGFLTELGYYCRGKVEPHLHASGYGPIDPSHFPRIEGLYDVHFLVAARDAADLPASYDSSTPVFGAPQADGQVPSGA